MKIDRKTKRLRRQMLNSLIITGISDQRSQTVGVRIKYDRYPYGFNIAGLSHSIGNQDRLTFSRSILYHTARRFQFVLTNLLKVREIK